MKCASIRKFTNMWKLNRKLVNNQWVKEEITWEITKYFEKDEKETQYTKMYGM